MKNSCRSAPDVAAAGAVRDVLDLESEADHRRRAATEAGSGHGRSPRSPRRCSAPSRRRRQPACPPCGAAGGRPSLPCRHRGADAAGRVAGRRRAPWTRGGRGAGRGRRGRRRRRAAPCPRLARSESLGAGARVEQDDQEEQPRSEHDGATPPVDGGWQGANRQTHDAHHRSRADDVIRTTRRVRRADGRPPSTSHPSAVARVAERRRDHGRSEVDLALVDRVRAGHPVEEEQAGAVVDLVLQRPRLEPVGDQPDRRRRCRAARPPPPAGWPASRHRSGPGTDMQPSRPGRHRLASTIVALHSTNVAVHGDRLRVPGHVDREDLGAHPDLRRGQADAAGRHPHRGDQVGGEPDHLGGGRVDRPGRPG